MAFFWPLQWYADTLYGLCIAAHAIVCGYFLDIVRLLNNISAWPQVDTLLTTYVYMSYVYVNNFLPQMQVLCNMVIDFCMVWMQLITIGASFIMPWVMNHNLPSTS